MDHTIAGFRLQDLKWSTPSPEDAQRNLRRMAERSQRDAVRSSRGFGYRRCRNEVLQPGAGNTTFRDGWYYDTYSVAAGAAFPVTSMFATAIGSGGKTLAQTNLTGQGGQVPAGETLKARSMRIFIANPTTPADFSNILLNCSVEFKVRNTPIYQLTPGWWAAGFGALSYSAAQLGTAPAGTAAVTSTNNGFPSQQAVYHFNYPYDMESQLNFTVLWTPQTAFNMVAGTGTNPLGVGTTIQVWIEGDKQAVVTA